MKKPPDNPEVARFTAAMQTIVSVSKTELQRRMEDDKQKKSPGPTQSSPGRAQ